MIHILNRKELITVFSDQQLYRLQSALSSAGIAYQVKNSISPFNADRYHGTPFINSDASHPCVIYVKSSDYERARTTIQPVL
ncbi:MAG: DUF2007 domain-containing protein [Clostridia bacterium]|nr:DUF2007 domain-containing protein [Oscillospiraceae bacterium]MBQ7930075.1 DUF2007 domain-containing protein [Clostridia bacterium]